MIDVRHRRPVHSNIYRKLGRATDIQRVYQELEATLSEGGDGCVHPQWTVDRYPLLSYAAGASSC